MKITTVATAAVAGTFLALSAAGVANAGQTTGQAGVLSGNQVSVQKSNPADDCGDLTALQWITDAECASGEWADGVSWDGGYTSVTERAAGVSWDGGSFSYIEIIGSQFGPPMFMPVIGCGSGAGHDPSSCDGGTAAREHRGTSLSKSPSCPCTPMPCQCETTTCGCGASHGHRVSPHKHLRYPVRHAVHPITPVRHAAHIPTPVASKAHGAPTPIRGMLPITGVNLAGITGSGFGLLGTGAGALFGATRVTNRRRRRGPA